MRSISWCLITLLLIAAALVAGCTTATTNGTSANTTVPAAPAGDRLVFLTEEYPPFNYHDGGRLTGISIDLLNETLQRLGTGQTTDEVQILPWEVAYNRTLVEPNTVLFATSRLASREHDFLWAGPLTPERSVLFALREHNISIGAPTDLARLTIGVVRNDAAIQKLVDLGVPAANIHQADRQEELPAWLDEGEVDLFAYGEGAGRMLAQQGNGSVYRFVPVYTLAEVQTWFAFNRNTSTATVARFQAALDRLSTERDADNISVRDRILARYVPEVALAQMTFRTEEYPPYSSAANGTVEGVAPDLLRATAGRLNATLRSDQIVIGTWADAYRSGLETDNTVIFSTARTPEREALFQWAGPIARLHYVVLADPNRTMSADGLADLRIATIRDSASVAYLRERGVPDAKVRYESGPGAMIEAVSNGSADALAYSLLPARSLLSQHGIDPNRFAVIETLGEHELYFAFNRNVSPLMVNTFNRTLAALKTDKDAAGVAPYERILYRYVGPERSSAKANRTGAMAVVNLTAERLAADTAGTLEAINRGAAPYRDPADPEVYAFVYDTNQTMVAHAANYHLVGQNYRGKTDVTGKAFRDQFLATALSEGSGWVDYTYVNLAESRLSEKTTYCRLTRGSDGHDYVVCAGTFRDGGP